MVLRFDETWKFMSKTNGIWYSLVKEKKGLKNAYPLCSSDFKIESDKLPIPFWIQDEDIIYNLTPLIINEEFKEEFKSILENLIKHSPIKTLMFLARYQGAVYEVIQGKLTLNEFFKCLNKKNIV